MTLSRTRSEPLISAAGRLVLFASLAWAPILFGSVTRAAAIPLVVGPAAACILGFVAVRFRHHGEPALSVQRHGLVWVLGGVAFISLVAFELVPLPRFVVRLVSGQAFEIWSGADHVRVLLDPDRSATWFYPLTVDPPATRLHLARLVAFLAAFVASVLLVRRRAHRVALAAVLGATATFEVLYGMKQYATHSREIWGWENLLIHNRVTGTFVNPNHFAHYLAIVLPLGLYLVLAAWERSRARGGSLARVVARLLDRNAAGAALGLVIMFVCAGGMLVAQSRGALLASFVGVGTVLVAGQIRGRRPLVLPRRISESKRRLRRLAATASLVFGVLFAIMTALAIWIGAERTVTRFVPAPGQTLTLVGRTVGFRAAFNVWLEFPLFGSGLGTFGDVVLMGQDPAFRSIFTHAHNDYLEVLATTGVIGFVVGAGSLFIGLGLLARYVFGPVDRVAAEEDGRDDAVGNANDTSTIVDHPAFAVAALAALLTAMVHAMFDFNFYIPSNPLTLAAILGAASAVPPRSRRTSKSG